MTSQKQPDQPQQHTAPLEMSPEGFRQAGHQLVDQISDFLAELHDKQVTVSSTQAEIRQHLGSDSVPQFGAPVTDLLRETADLLFEHSLFNGHSRFWGYITSSAAPIGALADMLAAAVNPNVGAWQLSPVASEIEAQTIRWIADMLGYPPDCGGLLVSGGNMANFVCFLAARTARADKSLAKKGLFQGQQQLRVYASEETHTWIQKAADLFGLGTDAICWLPLDSEQRMNVEALATEIVKDREAGSLPFLVIGTAGSVSTGAVDPLPEIAAICRQHNLWFHVDGAYGAMAAVLPEASEALQGLSLADSIAVDPHKWLYTPLEAGCVLVRQPQHLVETFSYHPEYYNFAENDQNAPINYYEIGPQNSRGFRALKVWLSIRQAGKSGYIEMIRDNTELAGTLYDLATANPELEACTQSLSITTFRYVPLDLDPGKESSAVYLNDLNRALLDQLQHDGQAYVSNAIVAGKFLLRACIVNFRTKLADIEFLPNLVVQLGRNLDAEMRPRAQ